mmetsp:Transcript_32129/g.91132  ORF Transcript_32129/g.91132 Transcript_32129/m.91132 type:complete len:320 (-) Transcript_32129:230-1189(-)
MGPSQSPRPPDGPPSPLACSLRDSSCADSSPSCPAGDCQGTPWAPGSPREPPCTPPTHQISPPTGCPMGPSQIPQPPARPASPLTACPCDSSGVDCPPIFLAGGCKGRKQAPGSPLQPPCMPPALQTSPPTGCQTGPNQMPPPLAGTPSPSTACPCDSSGAVCPPSSPVSGCQGSPEAPGSPRGTPCRPGAPCTSPPTGSPTKTSPPGPHCCCPRQFPPPLSFSQDLPTAKASQAFLRPAADRWALGSSWNVASRRRPLVSFHALGLHKAQRCTIAGRAVASQCRIPLLKPGRLTRLSLMLVFRSGLGSLQPSWCRVLL